MAVVLLAASTALCGGGQPQATSEPAPNSAGRAAQPSGLPRGGEPVWLDPAEFTARIDHPYWPMTPGSRWVFRETDARGTRQRIEVTVTRQTRTILGIQASVVHDVVTEDGQVREESYDWYAQDIQGNLWYLGEDTKEYENGRVTTTKGSWQAGVDGAQPGILIPAAPNPGMAYRQEYQKGHAEDAAQVLSLDKRANVPSGLFDQVLVTAESTPLEPRREHKFYARGVGPVMAITVAGGSGLEELLHFEHGS